MKNNYFVVASKENDDFIWCVFEEPTTQVIASFYFEEDAIAMAKFMSKGGAFDGFTPTFMLRSVAPPDTNVNDEFSRVFV